MESSWQWKDFEQATELWEETIVGLEYARRKEKEARRMMMDAARVLEAADPNDATMIGMLEMEESTK